MTKRLLKCEEACARLGVGRSKFYSMIAAGIVPAPVKVVGSSRWPENEIDAVIEALIAARETEAA